MDCGFGGFDFDVCFLRVGCYGTGRLDLPVGDLGDGADGGGGDLDLAVGDLGLGGCVGGEGEEGEGGVGVHFECVFWGEVVLVEVFLLLLFLLL